MTGIRIALTSIPVNDQDRALAFYTEMLGFEKKLDIPMGEFRWLTVVSPAGADGIELVLEPDANPATKVYAAALRDSGTPWTMFFTDDIHAEHERLVGLDVEFRSPPTNAGGAVMAILDDTCGNLIALAQVNEV